jgi:hypothetical protein
MERVSWEKGEYMMSDDKKTRIDGKESKKEAAHDEYSEIYEIFNAMKVGAIWTVPDIHEQPIISLIRWEVRETSRGEQHFVGYNIEDHEGRVSSAIQSFNAETCKGITRSGRIYLLLGPAGYDPDGDYVWRNWPYASGIEWKDVSIEYAKKSRPKKPKRNDGE